VTLDDHRRAYAEKIAAAAGLTTPGLKDAFAAVPREAFLPPGPWLVVGEGQKPQQTPDADPRHVYENVSVAIDPARQLFNGAPAFLARMIDRLALRPGSRVLHIGAGLGYYSAVIADLVSSSGLVVATEIDEGLAAAAQSNLRSMPWVTVECVDGRGLPAVAPRAEAGSFDAILVNTGVTHPLDAWLDALAPGGRLLLPLTVGLPGMGSLGKGVVVVIARTPDGAAFSAEVLSFVAIYSAIGLRDAGHEASLGQALRRTSFPNLTRLRRDGHDSTPDCWLHADTFCLSMAETST
jgi:protein-L-isoaspartate(D-aspartate) O-methyltransferase